MVGGGGGGLSSNFVHQMCHPGVEGEGGGKKLKNAQKVIRNPKMNFKKFQPILPLTSWGCGVGYRPIFCIYTLEFSPNYTVENTENLESVKNIPGSNFKMCSGIGNIQGFHDKEILQIYITDLYSSVS